MIYEQRLGIRKRLDGRESVLNCKDGKILPLPRPIIDPEYVHEQQASRHHGFNSVPTPHEDKVLISKFRNPFYEVQDRPVKTKAPPLIKYNHFEMNYAGWNR